MGKHLGSGEGPLVRALLDDGIARARSLGFGFDGSALQSVVAQPELPPQQGTLSSVGLGSYLVEQELRWRAEREGYHVNWAKYGDAWFSLDRLDLSTVPDDGVYVIWHGGHIPRYVRVGQGPVAKRAAAHRDDPEITAYRAHGPLFITWTPVPEPLKDGVERYLGDVLQPKVGQRFPDALPIRVNLPA